MLRRIVRHAEYLSFQNAEHSFRTPHFRVPTLITEADCFAFGITVRAKIGNAVKRNRLKRRLKAWFYKNVHQLPAKNKINLIARNGAGELDWPDICDELSLMIGLLKKQKLIHEAKQSSQ